MRKSLSTSLLVPLAMSSALAVATPDHVVQRKDVSLAMANDLLNAALAACHAQGRTAVGAVVDRGGNLVAVQRDDDVGPHNTLAAQRKAYTALSTKTPTRLLSTGYIGAVTALVGLGVYLIARRMRGGH